MMTAACTENNELLEMLQLIFIIIYDESQTRKGTQACMSTRTN